MIAIPGNEANRSVITRRFLLEGAAIIGLAEKVRLPLFAQGNPQSTAPVTVGTITQAEALQDFDLMRQALEEAHAGLYRYSNKIQIDAMFDVSRAKLNRSMSHTEFWGIISQALTAIRCGHTGTNPPADTDSAAASARKFPLRVQIEDHGRLVVLLNDSAEDRTVLPGMEVLEINGNPVNRILGRMFAVISGDGDILTSKQSHMDNFALYYWLLFDQVEQFRIKLKSASGSTMRTKLIGVLDSERGKNRNPVNAAVQKGLAEVNWSHADYALRFTEDPKIAEMTIRHFAGDQYRTWLGDSFRTLHEKGIESLILDLRGNGGGVDLYGASLISHLVPAEFRYFDHIHLRSISPAFKAQSDWNERTAQMLKGGTVQDPNGGYLVTPDLQPGLMNQRPAEFPFLGKLVVLTNGRTFSTAADVAAVLKNLKRGTFIGQETGGCFYGNNSGIKVTATLPNSRLHIGIPMWAYWNAVEDERNRRHGTIPDQNVFNTASSLALGKDDVRAAALRQLRSS